MLSVGLKIHSSSTTSYNFPFFLFYVPKGAELKNENKPDTPDPPPSKNPVSSIPEPQPQDDSGEIYSINRGKARILVVITAPIAGFFFPLSANIYLPALNTLADQLHVSNTLN